MRCLRIKNCCFRKKELKIASRRRGVIPKLNWCVLTVSNL